MELLNVRMARSIWIIDTGDLNPRGVNLYPLVFGIKERYHFQHVDGPQQEQGNRPTANSVTFRDGAFSIGEQSYEIARLAVLENGLAVDTARDTDLSDEVIEDMLTFSKSFGFEYAPAMVFSKSYLSELTLRTEKSLDILFGPIEAARKHLCELTERIFEPFGFGFGVDTSTERPSALALFRFEREMGKLLALNRYYSSAPLRTVQHLSVLKTLESAL